LGTGRAAEINTVSLPVEGFLCRLWFYIKAAHGILDQGRCGRDFGSGTGDPEEKANRFSDNDQKGDEGE